MIVLIPVYKSKHLAEKFERERTYNIRIIEPMMSQPISIVMFFFVIMFFFFMRQFLSISFRSDEYVRCSCFSSFLFESFYPLYIIYSLIYLNSKKSYKFQIVVVVFVIFSVIIEVYIYRLYI